MVLGLATLGVQCAKTQTWERELLPDSLASAITIGSAELPISMFFLHISAGTFIIRHASSLQPATPQIVPR